MANYSGLMGFLVSFFGRKPVLSVSFRDRLRTLIETSAPYHYPEDKMQQYPDFTKPVAVDLSKMSVANRIRRALARLQVIYEVDGLEETFNNLSDEYSREMFLRVVGYAIFDEKPLRYPKYYYQSFWKNYDELKSSSDVLKLLEGDFYRYNLKTLGHDLDIYSNQFGITINFVNEQYSYRDIVGVKTGDFVIDGGACYGDTALSFASKVGKAGRIFSFEFIDENLEIFYRQMELNPEHASKVKLYKNPLGDNSSEILYSTYSGAGSYVSSEKTSASCIEHRSVSIDDIILADKIEKIDFIKLDIEGSELKALHGAVNCIKKFRPQLAICVYHKYSDLWDIPRFIKNTIPEYRLYLDHHTIMPWETVLYAAT
jgi:FkbM family methyltransferase